MPARREICVVGIQHQVLHGRLHLGVHRSLHGKAAGVQQLLGFGFGDVLLGHDILHQLREQCIGKIRGNRRVLLAVLFLGQHQRLGSCIAVLFLTDHALLPHVVHEEVAAVDEVFGIRIGVVVGGVLGNGRNGCAFPQGQLADIFIKVLVGRSLHALNGTGKADGVQVRFQNGLLGIAAAQAEGTIDLTQLAQCAIDAAGAVVIRQVFDELLFQRGRALLGAVDGQQILIDHCANGALEVDAGLVVEILILRADERILQVGRDLFQICPHAVAVGGAQGRVLHLCTSVRVGGHHHAGLAQLNVIQIQQIAVIGRGLHHVIDGTHSQQAACHYAQTEQGGNSPANEPQERMLFLFTGFLQLLRFPSGPGDMLRFPAAVTRIYPPASGRSRASVVGAVDLLHIGNRNRLLTFQAAFQRRALVPFTHAHTTAHNTIL